MKENFYIDIVSPEKIIFSDDISSVIIPSYEGNLDILKDHVSIITFLRPGIIKVEKDNKNMEQFFVEDGIIEFLNNKLVVLSASVENVKKIPKDFLENLIKNSEEKLTDKNISDHDRYMLNYKVEAIKEIRN